MTTALKGSQLVLLTLSLSLSIFMNVLDISIANVAIPTIAGNLAISSDEGTWIITSFAVSQAIMLPLTGWLGRRFGEIRLFILSTFLFTLASALCGLSTNLTTLLLFRVIQGMAAGPMIPLSQSLLLANYPDHQKGFAMGLWAMIAVVGPIFGPIIGGWITDNYSWPWIFYINLPVGILSVGLTKILLKGQETAITKTPVDTIGLSLLIVGIGCLQILLDQGKDLDWFNSNAIIILAIISGIALSFLVVWELTEKNPVVDLRLFAKRNFLIGTIVLTSGYLVYFSNVVIFPLWLQTQLGYTATWAGLAAAPVGILPVFLTPLVGRYMYKVDLRTIISFGFIIFAFTAFWMSRMATNVGFEQLVLPRFMQGIGISCFFTPLITITIAGLPPERIASALGLANFCRILGGSFGTSLSVTLWSRRETVHQSYLVDHINLFNPINHHTFQQLTSAGLSYLQQLAAVTNSITNQAFMLATNDIFWFSGCNFVCLIFLIWLAKPPFQMPKLDQ